MLTDDGRTDAGVTGILLAHQWVFGSGELKIHYLTLTQRSYKMLPSTNDIMWPMHQQSLMLLHPMVKEKMHLQENTLFDLDLVVKVTWNVAQCPLHHVTYAPTEFEVTTSNGLGVVTFTRKYIIWPLTLTLGSHKMLPSTLFIMWPIQLQFEVATSNSLGGDKFTRKYIISPWVRSHGMLPSTLYIMWPIQLQSLKLLCVTI